MQEQSTPNLALPLFGKVIFIYALSDETGIRYIGQTENTAVRLRVHLKDKRRTHKANWVRELLSQGKEPRLQVLETSDEENFQSCEQAWIAYGRATGWNLTNTTDGGIGTRGLKHSEATRKKMGDAKIGNAWNKGRVGNNLTQDDLKRVSEALTGRTHSEEHRRKIAEAGKGRIHSQETKAKLSALHTGKVMSPEARQKMSDAKKGVIPWNKGRECPPLSESTKQKISLAMKKHRQKNG